MDSEESNIHEPMERAHRMPQSKAPLNSGLAALDAALRQPAMFNNTPVRRALERERRIVKTIVDDRDREKYRRIANPPNPYPWTPDDDLFTPGPVTAILLDPQIPALDGEKLTARVEQILEATKSQTVARGHTAVTRTIAVSGPIGALAMGWAHIVPIWAILMFTMPMLFMGYVNNHSHRYPRLSLADAEALAVLRRTPTVDYGPSFATLPLNVSARSGKRDRMAKIRADRAAMANKLKADREAMAKLSKNPAYDSRNSLQSPLQDLLPHTSPGQAGPPEPQPTAAGRARRIAEVRAAVTEIDTEWVEYTLDTYAYFLSKPQLRNDDDPVIQEYRQAHADLRDLADALTDTATDSQITTAQQAARRALTAWGAANTHALKVGISDLSPSEEAALRRLHGLVNTLNDRSTPKAMWNDLKAQIIRTMDKLTVTSFQLDVVANLPVIAAESRLRALPAAPTTTGVDEPAS